MDQRQVMQEVMGMGDRKVMGTEVLTGSMLHHSPLAQSAIAHHRRRLVLLLALTWTTGWVVWILWMALKETMGIGLEMMWSFVR